VHRAGQHGLDTRLERIMVADGDRRRCVVALEGRKPAVRAEDSECLGESRFGAGDVAQGRVEGDVERFVGERKRPRV
jgi:hypothetical protein